MLFEGASRLTIQFRADVWTSKKGVWPTVRDLYGTKRFKPPPSVPMARRKHLFSFRTQKLSSPAAIILRKWETSTVPNYKKDFRIGSPFSVVSKWRQNDLTNQERVLYGVSLINFTRKEMFMDNLDDKNEYLYQADSITTCGERIDKSDPRFNRAVRAFIEQLASYPDARICKDSKEADNDDSVASICETSKLPRLKIKRSEEENIRQIFAGESNRYGGRYTAADFYGMQYDGFIDVDGYNYNNYSRS